MGNVNSFMKGKKMSKTQNEPPIQEFRAGRVKGAIWATVTKQDDRDVTSYSTRIIKSYRDKNGEWHETTTFFPDDLPRLTLVAQQCFEFIVLRSEGGQDA